MTKINFIQWAIVLNLFVWASCSEQSTTTITPNQFKGNDTERIQAAVDKAALTTGRVIISANNANGTHNWLLDSAILLPSNITVILENCVIQLSDSCRDNMFRSNNVGIGITNPNWVKNIQIVGIGDVLLKVLTIRGRRVTVPGRWFRKISRAGLVMGVTRGEKGLNKRETGVIS